MATTYPGNYTQYVAAKVGAMAGCVLSPSSLFFRPSIPASVGRQRCMRDAAPGCLCRTHIAKGHCVSLSFGKERGYTNSAVNEVHNPMSVSCPQSEKTALQWAAWEKQQKEIAKQEEIMQRLAGGAQSGRASQVGNDRHKAVCVRGGGRGWRREWGLGRWRYREAGGWRRDRLGCLKFVRAGQEG